VEKEYTINLPSFLRRTIKTDVLKAHIKLQQCDLNRIGRSRNWRLKANFKQIEAIIIYIESIGEPSWTWIIKQLKSQYKDFSYKELLKIAYTMENVTISALTAKTDCTIAQARQVIDELEGL
jgi:hypothetical protein